MRDHANDRANDRVRDRVNDLQSGRDDDRVSDRHRPASWVGRRPSGSRKPRKSTIDGASCCTS